VSDATSARELAARIIAALPHASLFDRLNVGVMPDVSEGAGYLCARCGRRLTCDGGLGISMGYRWFRRSRLRSADRAADASRASPRGRCRREAGE
jgi:hypothetical protein